MILKYKNLWLSCGWIMVATVIYLSLTPSPPQGLNLWDKLNHFIAYAGLMVWFGQIYRSLSGRIVFTLYFIGMGIGIEVLQGMGGVRQFEYHDMLANSIGVLAALLILKLNGDRVLFWVEQRFLKAS